jgi:DNA-directed RNA polymerase alpha subunit
MLETRNFGRKSLEEVQEVLTEYGLSLGMSVGS